MSVEHHYSASKFRAAAVFQFFGQATGSALGLVCAILLVRNLSVVDYAAYTGFSGAAALVCFMMSLGMDRVAGRFIPDEALSRGFGAGVGLALRLLLVRGVFVLLGTVAVFRLGLFHHEEGVWSTDSKILSLCTVYALCFALNEQLRISLFAFLGQKVVAQSQLVQWSIRLVMILGLVHFHGKLTLLDSVYITLVGEVSGVFVHLSGLLRHANRQPMRGFDTTKPRLQQMFVLALSNYTSAQLSLPIQGGFLRSFVVAHFPPQISAAFGFYYALYDRVRPYLPVQLLENVIEASLVVRTRGGQGRDTLAGVIGMLWRVNLFVIIPVAAWVYVFGAPLFGLMTGGKYGISAWIFSVLFLHAGVGTLSVLLLMTSNALGVSRYLVIGSGLAALVLGAFYVAGFGEHSLGAVLALCFVYSGVSLCSILVMLSRMGVGVLDVVKRAYVYLVYGATLLGVFFGARFLVPVNLLTSVVMVGVGGLISIFWLRINLLYSAEEKLALIGVCSSKPALARMLTSLLNVAGGAK